MLKLNYLRKISTKPSFAKALGVDPVFLTRCLYLTKPKNQYKQFEIPKKSGGFRVINAPTADLKSLQKKLSDLLLDCIDEINFAKYPTSQLASPKMRDQNNLDYAGKILKIKIPSSESKQPSLSHGFVKKRSIITNAMMHLGKKNVLNIDLENFFDSFNFGRVRGFFIKNKNFQLDPSIATIIAQIACYDNKLPQGSPCSPVITNLITHSLDICLASLAKRYKCTYTRYADDITFSTRLSCFPTEIMKEDNSIYIAGKKLTREINRAGFSINDKKTRIQHKDSRQDVTGLIVNKKPNTKKEYWRTARAKCNVLFKTGKFTTTNKDGLEVQGNINELQGQLNFIDQVDHHNRMRQKKPLNQLYEIKTWGKFSKNLLSGREKTFSQFLFYRLFYGNKTPTILCEGKTDNIYLKSAISELQVNYPSLATIRDNKYQLLIHFVEYSKRSRFLLELFGGADYLHGFIEKFENNIKLYNAPKSEHPVIIFLDNDEGPKKIVNTLKNKFNKKLRLSPSNLDPKEDLRKADFIHIIKNLYVVFTPLGKDGEDTDIEYFFDDKTRMKAYSNGKYFNTVKDRDEKTDLSKEAFASHIIKNLKKDVDFNGLKPLLDRIVTVIAHYNSIK